MKKLFTCTLHYECNHCGHIVGKSLEEILQYFDVAE